MIKLKKIEKPQILIDNAVEWTRQYCLTLSQGKIPDTDLATKYNHLTIKSQLEKETCGKCVYCESKIKHISYGDIEHILPKNKDARPDLYVEWDNLTLACEQCNRTGKRSYYDPKCLLINPYVDYPEKYFQDIGPLIMPVLGSERAGITEKMLKLNRAALIEKRTERIKSIEALVQLWSKEKNPTTKELLKEELLDEVSDSKEFSSTVKKFLLSRGFPVEEAT